MAVIMKKAHRNIKMSYFLQTQSFKRQCCIFLSVFQCTELENEGYFPETRKKNFLLHGVTIRFY